MIEFINLDVAIIMKRYWNDGTILVREIIIQTISVLKNHGKKVQCEMSTKGNERAVGSRPLG